MSQAEKSGEPLKEQEVRSSPWRSWEDHVNATLIPDIRILREGQILVPLSSPDSEQLRSLHRSQLEIKVPLDFG